MRLVLPEPANSRLVIIRERVQRTVPHVWSRRRTTDIPVGMPLPSPPVLRRIAEADSAIMELPPVGLPGLRIPGLVPGPSTLRLPRRATRTLPYRRSVVTLRNNGIWIGRIRHTIMPDRISELRRRILVRSMPMEIRICHKDTKLQ